MFPRRSLNVRETDMFAKTGSSTDAAAKLAGMHLRHVLKNMSVSCIKPSHMARSVTEIGTVFGLRTVCNLDVLGPEVISLIGYA